MAFDGRGATVPMTAIPSKGEGGGSISISRLLTAARWGMPWVPFGFLSAFGGMVTVPSGNFLR